MATHERRIAILTTQVEQLTAALEQALRSGKRQAAPFRKLPGPKPNPKKPGRKRGKRHGRHAHRVPAAPACHCPAHPEAAINDRS